VESESIVRDIESLPPEAQKEILDFVAFIKTRYLTASTSKKVGHSNLADEPFIGMWRTRQDMQNSTAWVETLRQRDWDPDRE
jgi:hypothetical protein